MFFSRKTSKRNQISAGDLVCLLVMKKNEKVKTLMRANQCDLLTNNSVICSISDNDIALVLDEFSQGGIRHVKLFCKGKVGWSLSVYFTKV